MEVKVCNDDKIVSVFLAKSDEQFYDVGRLRQRVFGDELNDNRYSCGEIQQDELDNSLANIVVACSLDNVIVGALRITRRAQQKFICDDAYNYPILSQYLSQSEEETLSSIALIDRVCVDPASRGLGVFKQMEEFAAALIAEFEDRALVCAIAPTNFRSQKAFLRTGYTKYWAKPDGLYFYVKDLQAVAGEAAEPLAEVG